MLSLLSVSDVYFAFNVELPRRFKELPDSVVSDTERAYFLHLNEKHFKFMYGDAHSMGFVLDPRYVGDGMPYEDFEDIEEIICSFPPEDNSLVADDERREAIYKELTNLLSMRAIRRLRTPFATKC